MTNKSVMIFFSVNKISVCLSVCLMGTVHVILTTLAINAHSVLLELKGAICHSNEWQTGPFNPRSGKLNYLNFHPFEVVSRYRDQQLQVGEDYPYLFILDPNICKS